MKKLLTLISMLLVVGTLSAQRVTVQREDIGDSIRITRIIPKWTPQHDFRFSIGTPSEVDDVILHPYYWSYGHHEFEKLMEISDTYSGSRWFLGAYSFSYTYQPRRWFQFGGTVSVVATTQSRFDRFTNAKVETHNQYAVSIMPTLRFFYMNRDLVQLYSALSFGYVLSPKKSVPYADVTVLGCSVGRNLFGFAEVGTGVAGGARIGIGYRFNAKKRSKK